MLGGYITFFGIILIILLFQKQLASTLWPSDSFLPKVAAKYGHKHATEPAYIEHVVNSAINIGHDVDGVKGMLMDKYMEYVSKNLLEVSSDAMSEFDITFW